jgi:hypothetical protein
MVQQSPDGSTSSFVHSTSRFKELDTLVQTPPLDLHLKEEKAERQEKADEILEEIKKIEELKPFGMIPERGGMCTRREENFI